MMLTFLANPLVRKIAIYGAITLGILYALRLYGNAQWTKGEAQGRKAGALEMERSKKAEWDQERKSIDAEKADLKSQRSALGAQTEQLKQSRRAIDASLAKIQTMPKTDSEAACATVLAVPASLLDDALRAKSAALGSPK